MVFLTNISVGLKTGLLSAVLVFCGTVGLLAQNLADTISIEEVQVYGKRKLEEQAVTITQIDTLALKMMKTQSISDLLSTYSPVFIKSYGRGSTATASFRGTAPSHTQVFWNGMKLNSPMRGDVDFSLFPVYFIDEISLQHGGSSLQSGSGALGGSILLGNKPVWSDRISLRYVQNLESFGTYKEYLNLGLGNSRIQAKTRVFAERSENDFPYFNYGVLPMHEAVQQNAGYNKKGLLQELYFRQMKNVFSLKFWAYDANRDLPQLMSFEGNSRIEKQHDQNFRGVLSWKYAGEKFRMEYFGGLNYNKLNYFRSSTEANFVNFDSRSKENSMTNQVNVAWTPIQKLSFDWSLNSIYDGVSIFDFAQKTGYDKNRLEFSLMNSVHTFLLPKLSLSVVCRSDLYDSKLIGFIPAIGFEYYTDKNQQNSFRINLSRNYHQPSLNDLYWLPGGNPDLKPEDGYSGDLGFSFAKRLDKTVFSGQITTFASLIDNWIVWQPSASGAYFWEAQNLRTVFSRGAEIAVSFRRNLAKDIECDIRTNYSYTATSNMDAVPSVDESRGKQLIYIPKHKANFFAELDWKRYYFKVNAPFTGKRYTSSNNAESDFEKILNPYWLINVNAGRSVQFRRITVDLSLNVENLANTDYMAILWRPMPGRYYSLTLQINYRN